MASFSSLHRSFLFPRAQNPGARRVHSKIRRIRSGKRVAQRILAAVFAGGFLALSAAGHAQAICPWLNVATASGVLGGGATLTVTKTGEDTGTCVFRRSGNPEASMTISVAAPMQGQDAAKDLGRYAARCTSAGVPLKAVGNEAVLCAGDTTKSHSEQVIGRVRESIFTINLSAGALENPGADDPLAEKVEAVAEQVAGSLF